MLEQFLKNTENDIDVKKSADLTIPPVKLELSSMLRQ